MPKPLIYIIIVNWNGKKDTLECLASLEKVSYPNFKTIIIDNGSKDDSISAIEQGYPNVTMIPTHQNLGFAEGTMWGFAMPYQVELTTFCS